MLDCDTCSHESEVLDLCARTHWVGRAMDMQGALTGFLPDAASTTRDEGSIVSVGKEKDGIREACG